MDELSSPKNFSRLSMIPITSGRNFAPTICTWNIKDEHKKLNRRIFYYGLLGDDNLYISVPDLEVQLSYTYETDIHLAYASINRFVEQVKNRWDSDQWLARGKFR